MKKAGKKAPAKASKKAAKKTAKKAPARKVGKKAAKKAPAKKAAKKAPAKAPAKKKAPARKAAARPAAKPAPKAPAKAAPARRAVPRKETGRPLAPGQPPGTERPVARVVPGGEWEPEPAEPKPAPKRTDAFYDHFRTRLLEERSQITRRLDELREELRGLQDQPRELEEWAQEEKDRDILIRLEERETEELRRIQASLQMIDQRDYGTCQVCGRPISRARLEELPTAFRCIHCMA